MITGSDEGPREPGTGRVGWVEERGLWTDEQHEAGKQVLHEIRALELEAVRVVFGDVHGIVRGKTLSARALEGALRNGVSCTTGPYFFDTGRALALNPFAPGAGLGLDELTGVPDFVLVPDPTTFRVLPWTDGPTGWLLADEYFTSGKAIPLSGRALLKRQLTDLGSRQLELRVGIEIEWYLTRLVDPLLTLEAVSGLGAPGPAPRVVPVNLGLQLHSELQADALDGILRLLRQALVALGLPLRTVEHESGPGQLEFTFDPQPALAAADGVLLFRNAVKQLCARHGYHASFMCCPRLSGFDASGWHLHQSLVTAGGENAFMSKDPATPVSELARHYVGGLTEHARAASAFTTPTVNGYKRFADRFKLSPDRICWSRDNRGAFIRVLGEPGDPAAHIENRAGEPAANPYLYLASQVVAGMDGVERRLHPGQLVDNPHAGDAPRLPGSLREAVDALKADQTFRERAGATLVDYLVRLKESELGRYERAIDGLDSDAHAEAVTEWEHREYFRVF
jgi:glutamine synthetase